MLGAFLAIGWPDLHSKGLSSFFEESARGFGKNVKGGVAFVTFVLIALGACFYGIAVLCGQAGKMEILGKVLVFPPGGVTSEPDSGSLSAADAKMTTVPGTDDQQ